jgi:ribosomal protein S18 acetylase RimI-like enzyme
MALALRPATPADVYEVARVHVRAWQVGYRGILPDAYLDGLRPEDRVSRYTFGDPDPEKPFTIVAVDRSSIVGFVTTGPAREGTGGAGHLMALYVDPEHWQRGIGRTLIARGRDELAGRGYREAVLWVLAGNERAQRFYAADAWVFDGHVDREEIWGIVVTDHRYRRRLDG